VRIDVRHAGGMSFDAIGAQCRAADEAVRRDEFRAWSVERSSSSLAVLGFSESHQPFVLAFVHLGQADLAASTRFSCLLQMMGSASGQDFDGVASAWRVVPERRNSRHGTDGDQHDHGGEQGTHAQSGVVAVGTATATSPPVTTSG
jgi:hypothetical protein